MYKRGVFMLALTILWHGLKPRPPAPLRPLYVAALIVSPPKKAVKMQAGQRYEYMCQEGTTM